MTYNACASLKWNGGVSFPIQSGHGRTGCSEPQFGIVAALPAAVDRQRRRARIGIAAAGGVALGAASALLARKRQAGTPRRTRRRPEPWNCSTSRGPAPTVALAIFVLARGPAGVLLPRLRDLAGREGAPPAAGRADRAVAHVAAPEFAQATLS